MDIVLLPDETAAVLSRHYRDAFTKAVELYVVSAYLTNWEAPAPLPDTCKTFCIVVGSDFGITRKAACKAVASWLPARFRHRFLIADGIEGFHPKAIFWREADGTHYGLVGSSNLTRAAFSKNYEANVYTRLTRAQFDEVRAWMKTIETGTVQFSDEWLDDYEEARPPIARKPKKSAKSRSSVPSLPHVADAQALLVIRRKQMKSYAETREALERLVRKCADKGMTSKQFYDELPEVWGWDANSRLQGRGWERMGKGADFRNACKSFVRIMDADDHTRDDVVVSEIDRLHGLGVPVRRAFLSEMLCLRYPDLYPILNAPIEDFKKANGFRAARGSTEGSRYLALAAWLRATIAKQPRYPARDLAELDTLLWAVYGRKKRP